MLSLSDLCWLEMEAGFSLRRDMTHFGEGLYTCGCSVWTGKAGKAAGLDGVWKDSGSNLLRAPVPDRAVMC